MNAPTEARETADDVQEVKVGSNRATAIHNLLQGATDKSFQLLISHLSVMGAAKSALSDSMLNCKALWPVSQPAEGFMPSAAEEVTRQAGRKSQLLPKRLTASPVEYNVPLSPSQHDMLVHRLLPTYEGSVADAVQVPAFDSIFGQAVTSYVGGMCSVGLNSLIWLLGLTVPSIPIALGLKTQSALVAVGVVGWEQASKKLA